MKQARFHEQCSWIEMKLHGTQLRRPEMTSFEERFLESMSRNTDIFTSVEKVPGAAAAA
jgi:hypothetical protein